MIGLGSNRLSVCRRGGMSVTQAGRGGMEWLAGGRMPSWASPYSAQATAALRAQFPTQWPTIRDYGFRHPALVPFINEDPMLVMSLIEGLGTRWIVGDGVAYLVTNFKPDNTCELIIDAILSARTTVGFIRQGDNRFGFGASSAETSYLLGYCSVGDNVVRSFTSSILKYTDRNIHSISGITEQMKIKSKATGATLFTGNISPSVGTFTMTAGLPLFCTKNLATGTTVNSVSGLTIFEAIAKRNNVEECHWVPCKHNNESGMLDIVAAHWEGNANIVNGVKQGSFTISETPAS